MDERPARRNAATTMRRHRSAATRTRIMAAAEEVFARDGVATGSMAAILRAAGQRNEAAIAYHFGSREGLAVAILEARREPVAAYRKELISQATADGGVPTVREAVGLLVRPQGRYLETHAGRNYLRILADIFRRLSVADRQRPRASDARQALRLVEARLVHLPEEIVTERVSFAFSAMVEAFGQRATDLEHHSDPHLDDQTWLGNMTLMLEAILTAPLPEVEDDSSAGG